MSFYYLDSSVAAYVLLGGDRSSRQWFDNQLGAEPGSVLSSRILKTELTRLLRRESVPVRRRDALLDYVDLVPLSESVLIGAEAITVHVKTFDAIHLASALATGLGPTVVTHDATMADVAEQLGLTTHDPVC